MTTPLASETLEGYKRRMWLQALQCLSQLRRRIEAPSPVSLLDYTVSDYDTLIATARKFNCAIQALERTAHGQLPPPATRD
jgi:hypothetical protein